MEAKQLQLRLQAGMQAMPMNETLEDRLRRQLVQAKAEVLRLEELSQLLKEHPEVNRVLELLGSQAA